MSRIGFFLAVLYVVFCRYKYGIEQTPKYVIDGASYLFWFYVAVGIVLTAIFLCSGVVFHANYCRNGHLDWSDKAKDTYGYSLAIAFVYACLALASYLLATAAVEPLSFYQFDQAQCVLSGILFVVGFKSIPEKKSEPTKVPAEWIRGLPPKQPDSETIRPW